MTKLKTYPWDPSEHITDSEDVICYLQVVSPEEYDPDVAPFMLDCIARSKGVAEIAGVEFSDTEGGGRSVTITTTSGVEETIAIAPAVSLESVRQALTPRDRATPVSG